MHVIYCRLNFLENGIYEVCYVSMKTEWNLRFMVTIGSHLDNFFMHLIVTVFFMSKKPNTHQTF
jgi:hypothetical protein